MIHVILNVLDEAHNLPRCLESIDRVLGSKDDLNYIFCDGAYPEFASEHRLSTDGTRDIADRHGSYIALPDVDECGKRTAALRYIDTVAQDDDWVLVMDADEELTQLFGWPQRVGSFSFTRDSDGRSYGRCRLYRWEPGLHFSGRHYWLYDAENNFVSNLEDAPHFDTIGFGLHHDQSHSPNRVEIKKAYYGVLHPRERALTSPGGGW